MFSKALAIMDRNTVKYMMEYRKKIRQPASEDEQQAGKIEQLASENEHLTKKGR